MIIGLDIGISATKVVGRMTTLPHVAEIFERLNKLYGVNFVIARQSTRMMAIGAAIKAL